MFRGFVRAATSAVTFRCTNSPIILSASINNNIQHHLPSSQISVRHATKKAGGSSNNGRDSAGRRLGIKVWPGTLAKPGGIIVRQRGKKFLAGQNVGMGNDHTVFAKVAGRVWMERSPKNKKRHFVHVDPVVAGEARSLIQ